MCQNLIPLEPERTQCPLFTATMRVNKQYTVIPYLNPFPFEIYASSQTLSCSWQVFKPIMHGCYILYSVLDRKVSDTFYI
jgi:hypothetical protein